MLNNSHQSDKDACLYPDIFDCGDFTVENDTEDERWNSLSQDKLYSELYSSLILAKSAGIQISSVLDGRITHVLCNLLGEVGKLSWDPHSFDPLVFKEPTRGSQLHKKLLEVKALNSENTFTVTFVSPSYLRSQWKI